MATEKWSLREKIADRLVLAGPVAIPALLEMLENGLWYSRAATLKALGRMGDWRALLPVLNACWDQNQTVSEDGLQAVLDFCRRGFTLAVAKIVHSRGPIARHEFAQRLQEIDAAAVGRFQRLWEERELMGPEARLSKGEEKKITETVRDDRWGLVWADLIPSEPLKIDKRSVLEPLTGPETNMNFGLRAANKSLEKPAHSNEQDNN
ncbi:MAG: hypothetical protein KJ970_16200 [Candidatus Eisenbacteria bacterium]|uniref:HEAT repeat domain-containing protein n=1 Tax=Eiseniibacteriota bacterium TaxID=2212470 RepID=A0A948S252_UNCEI|nr:hypothetical protein [Candidatus Eisenbacteria bacterium]MBU1947355.1 hypothetical protein [Candidatus Eisenbacteria bacterium]MBU2692464.1 hypothetical protein [Candidatus Eisenbacteria bacterium]